MVVIQIALATAMVGSLLYYLVCAWLTHQFASMLHGHHSRSLPSSSDPGVSILVPICGIDPDAYQNWSALCHQHYGTFEVLFGVRDPRDPALQVVKAIEQAFPDRVRVLVGLEPVGLNHKDSTLMELLKTSQHELVIMVDSDMRVTSDYVRRVTAPLADPKVGLVTCVYVGREPQFFSSALASFGRCFDFIPGFLIARVLDGGLRYGVGATMATRKSTLTVCGGLRCDRIGSDYNLGQRVSTAGYRVELSDVVLECDTGSERMRDLYRRELRWARTTRFNRGREYYGMVLCFGTAYCLPLLLVSQFAPWTIALTVAVLASRLLQVIVSMVTFRAHALGTWLWALPVRDVLSFLVWAVGAVGSRVYWRGRWLQIVGDGRLTQEFQRGSQTRASGP